MTAVEVPNLKPGTVILEKYRVIERLGMGGMGVVISAEHTTLGSRVAIKFLLPQLVYNDQIVQRFVFEAKAAIKIKSEHVAQVLDVGTAVGEGWPDTGLPYMIMELLEGRDLHHWIESGKRFSLEEAVGYIAQAGEALANAHFVGIVHRDVKPANLFLTHRSGEPTVKILDFGISKLLNDQPEALSLTQTSTILGSGLYMSPEQMRSAKKVDHRTDIYSLGVCMYELLSGSQPHTAETFSELCIKVSTEEPIPLRTWRPDISEDAADVIAKAYARDLDTRYQTVHEFLEALRPYASPPSLRTIEMVQQIHLEPAQRASYASLSDIRASDVGTASADMLAKTAAGQVTAVSPQEAARRRTSMGMMLTVAVSATVLALGVGVFVLRSGGPNKVTAPTPATDARILPTAERANNTTRSDGPTATPAAQPSATGDDGAGGSGPQAVASASASATPAKTGISKRGSTGRARKPGGNRPCFKLRKDGLMGYQPCP